jgi:hypothetical protein
MEINDDTDQVWFSVLDYLTCGEVPDFHLIKMMKCAKKHWNLMKIINAFFYLL